MFFIGLISFIICYSGAGLISEYIIGDMGAKRPLEAIAPALIFVPVMSAFRGYFQGLPKYESYCCIAICRTGFQGSSGINPRLCILNQSLVWRRQGLLLEQTAGSIAGLLVIVLYIF